VEAVTFKQLNAAKPNAAAQRRRSTLLCHRCHARTVLQRSNLQHMRESNPERAGTRPTQVGHGRRGEKVRYRKADLTDKQRQEGWRPRPDSESRALSRVERTPARSLCVALFYQIDTGESLRSRGLITSEPSGTRPRSRIADIPPRSVTVNFQSPRASQLFSYCTVTEPLLESPPHPTPCFQPR